MLCFLGLRVIQPLTQKLKWKDCLLEMRHYLSLRKVELFETDYILTANNQTFSFSIPKNPLYLCTNFYNMPLFNTQDYDFLDTCYECLMIIQEAFPLSVKIELVSDSEEQELQGFQSRKEDELNRRINSNLRTLTQSQTDLTHQDVQNIIFLIQHHYTRKNKVIALKLLITKVAPSNVADLPEEFIEFIVRLQEQGDLKKTAGELTSRIRSIQAECQREKENMMKMSNLTENKYGEGIKLHPLIFQLKESYNLQRVCTLLASTLNADHDKDFWTKLESAITGEFEQAGRYGNDFAQLLKRFWSKRGKKWDQTVRISLENKIRSANVNSRVQTNKSRIATSRNDC